MTSKPSIKAVIFDMDGVLVVSEHIVLRAAKQMLAEYGVSACDADFEAVIGASAERYFGEVAEKYGVPYRPEMSVRAFELYGQMLTPDDIAPTAHETIRRIRRMGLKTAVCSGAPMIKIRHNIRAIGVTPSDFDVFVSGDDVSKNKPDPEIYTKGIAALGVLPSECIIIEDTINGIRAARAAEAGITVGVGTTLTREKFDASGCCDVFIDSLAQFCEVVSAAVQDVCG